MNAVAALARAERIGADALRAVTPGVGQVVAVFHRSLYIRCGAAWACIGTPDIGAGPLNVLADFRCDWSTLAAVGDPVRISAQRLTVGRVPLDLAGAQIWAPPRVPPWTKESLAAGLALLDDMVPLYPPPAEGLGYFLRAGALPPALEARAAAPTVDALVRWLAGEGDMPDVAPLIGLGPGLTPSGDDYLAGVLVALHAIGWQDHRAELWNAIAPLRARLTGPISAAHLECAAEGRAAERQHLIMNAILAEDSTGLEEGLAALARESHTSSWDGLAGMVSVLRSLSVVGRHGRESGSCKEARQLHTTR